MIASLALRIFVAALLCIVFSCLYGAILAMLLFHDLRDESARELADGEDAGWAGLDHDLDHISGAQRDHA